MIDKKLKSEAFELRANGYSYRQINKKLGIAKSTLNDWFSPDGRQKTLKRNASLTARFRRKVSRAGFKIKGVSTFDLVERLKNRNFCYLCGNKIDLFIDKYDLDHVQPKSKGGNSQIKNLHPACSDCNYLKGNLSLDDLFVKIKEIEKFAFEENIEYTYSLYAKNPARKKRKKSTTLSKK